MLSLLQLLTHCSIPLHNRINLLLIQPIRPRRLAPEPVYLYHYALGGQSGALWPLTMLTVLGNLVPDISHIV